MPTANMCSDNTSTGHKPENDQVPQEQSLEAPRDSTSQQEAVAAKDFASEVADSQVSLEEVEEN